MNTLIYTCLPLLSAFFFCSATLFSQIEFKLQLVGEHKWGVYARPAAGVDISLNTITGSGQATVVVPSGYEFSNLVSVHGLWSNNAGVDSPTENPGVKYISFGLELAEPVFAIPLIPGEETLLFTFRGVGGCPDFMYLIDCGAPNQSDPFCPVNGPNSNPGNELSVADFNTIPVSYYQFSDNYAPSAWDCRDSDGDGYANAQEDTDGNGIYDPADASDLNNPAFTPPVDGLNFKLALLEENKWGVFVKPHNLPLSTETIVGSGKVTLVIPKGYNWSNLESVHGLWEYDASVVGPVENPTSTYEGINMRSAQPDYPIPLIENEETLLFTFEGDGTCPEFIYLIECGTPYPDDPFCSPNSANSLPGNNFSVADHSTNPPTYHYYKNNYGHYAWDCNDCDNDGTPNGLEDTNGSGSYEAGVDVSDMCGTCNNNTLLSATLSANGYDGVSCYTSNVEEEINVQLEVQGGEAPYTVVFNNGLWMDTIHIFIPGDPIFISNSPQTAGGHIIPLPTQSTIVLLEKILDANGCAVAQDSLFGNVEITILWPAEITQQPIDVTTCAGDLIEFNAKAEVYDTSEVIDYQWEISSDGLNFTTITDAPNGVFSGFKANTLTVNNSAGMYGMCFIMAASTASCGTVYSDPACLTLEGPFEITDQPEDYVTCSDGDAIFNIGIQNFSTDFLNDWYIQFQWEESADNGLTWMELTNGLTPSGGDGVNGVNSDSLTIMEPAGRNGHLFRVKIFSEHCDTIISETAILSIDEPLEVVGQPVDVTACFGSATEFSAEISNLGNSNSTVEYQWQYSADEVDWIDVPSSPIYGGVQTPELSILHVNGLDKIHFRLSANSSTCGLVFTESAQLDVIGEIYISNHPEDYQTCYGSGFEMAGGVWGDLSETIDYQWEMSSDGINFTLINSSQGGLFEGFDTPTLKVGNSENMAGFCFRMAASVGGCEPIFTDPGCLILEGPFEITEHPTDQYECGGNDALFWVGVENYSGNFNEIEYHWQVSEDGGITWHSLINGLTPDGGDGVNGANSDTVTVMETIGRNGHLFRAMIFTDHCDTIYSDAATLYIEGFEITHHPEDVQVCDGEWVCLAVTVESVIGGSINYDWQYSVNGGLSWINAIGGANSDTYCFYATADINGVQFRVRVDNDSCGTVSSEPALIVVEGPLEIEIAPTDTTRCPDESHTFQSKINVPIGSAQPAHQWQYSTDNGLTWADLAEAELTPNGGQYFDVKTENLFISKVEGLDGHQYRLRSYTTHCEVFTPSANLSVEAGPNCGLDVPEVTLGLKLLNQVQGVYGVVMKPKPGYIPSGENILTGGEITVVADHGFAIKNVVGQAGGNWTSTTHNNLPDQSGLRYFTFTVAPNSSSIHLKEEGTVLFRFTKKDNCPDTLYLMDGTVPAGLHPNFISGIDLGNSPQDTFLLGGYHPNQTIGCIKVVVGEVPPDDDLPDDGFASPGNNFIAPPGNDVLEKTDQPAFRCYPNPADQLVYIKLIDNGLDIEKNTTIRLLNLQGQVLKTKKMGEAHQASMDLEGLASGLYFIQIEKDGKVVQREKLVRR